MSKKFYVTTPIYYANSKPHVGSAYTTLAADVLARWHKQEGIDVFFLTGLDEHGQKIQETAEKKGIKPKAFVDKIALKFKAAFKLLNIANDNFIRTTDPEHEKEVKKILQKLYDKKYIYKGHYEAHYCIGCEQYLTKRDLVNDKCPLHNRKPELKKEEAYLFRLSSFQNELLELIKSEKFCILPKSKRKEAISFIEQGLQDISISRRKEKVYWGIELPFDKEHSCFVWVDAFWNYLTGLKTKENFAKFWSPDVQLMAKDILRVHSTIWPALLLALNIELPKKLFIHGYFTVDGQKMSKTLGNIIDPVDMVNKYGVDALRYILLRDIPFGQDGDFSERALVERYNAELANELGNLVSRTVAMIVKYKDSKIPNGKLDSKLSKLTESVYKTASEHIENVDVNRAVEEIWKLVRETNKYIQSNKPWTLKGKKLDDVLFNCANAIKNICILAWPYIPSSIEEIVTRIGLKKVPLHSDLKSTIKGTVKKGASIFPKLEYNAEKKVFNLDIRKGKIVKIEDVPKSEKLYKLLIDFGAFKRVAVAGVKPYFKVGELKGKSFVFLTNLAPAKLAGIKSECMILAVEDKGKVDLLTSTGKVELEGYVSEPAKTVSLSDFSNYKFKVKDGKVLCGDAILKGVSSKLKKGRVV